MKKGNILAFVLCCSFPYLSALFPPSLVDTRKCIKRNGNFPKTGSFCRTYYKCRNWYPAEITCPGDEHFFPEKGYCVQPEMYPCFEKPKYKECPVPNGFFLIPNTGCKEYYDCCNGVPTKKRCSRDSLFNQERRSCDWSEFVTCPDEDEKCLPNSCHNGGTCNVTKGKVTCFCRDPFIGERCEKNQCCPSPCSNDGICNVTNGKVTCSCKDPFIGERCEKNQCLPNPCNNAGTCNVANGKVTCSCKDPFIGERCEKNQCNPNPCSNDGTCNVANGKITCSCKDPFIGERCEKNQCLPNPCFNEGRCYAKQGEVACFCDYPFSGKRCEIDIRTTSVEPKVVTVHIFCPESNGYFPHPNNKHKFVACLDGDPTVMDCPSDLVYDHDKGSCEYDLS